MNTARRITTNFMSLAFSEVISKILQLLVFAYIARKLGNDNFGIFSFAISFSLLIAITADFGLSTLLIREISRDKKSVAKYLSNALFVKVLLSLITVIASYIFLNSMRYSPEVKIIAYVMLLFAIMQSFTDVYYAIFRAFEQMYYDAIIKVLRMLILVGMVIYAIKNNYGLFAASLAFPVTETVILIFASLIAYKKFTKVDFYIDYEFSKKLLKSSFLFFLSLVFSGIFMYIDAVIISKVRSTAEVGIYSAAANIILALIFIPMMYGNSIYPVISRLYTSSKKSLKFAYERSFKYMLLLGIPLSAAIYVLSDKIILLLYGNQYKGSAIILSVLCWYIFLRFVNVVSGFTLTSINKQGSRVFSQGIAAFASITLNFILIPFYGILGAAIAAIITEAIFFSMYAYFIFKHGLKINFLMTLIKSAGAAAIMAYLITFVENIFLAAFIGIVVYGISLLIFRAIDKEDMFLVKKVINNI
ncbi:oligosaccharide flippase family protein [Candidatus Woesearchaeota archaeon]|nr:oligosaccharide flippase family protein [Candidatus Woesearchaeota archaeon]